MNTSNDRLFAALLSAIWMAAALAGDAAAQGIIVSTSGPVNRSMGGAAVAAPLEAIGALRWNPASVSGLQRSELGFSADLIWPNAEVDSSIAGFGAGTTESDSGVSPVPAVGWVHKVPDSPLTFGLGMFGVAGFRANYPASMTNPLLLPQAVGGLGRIYSSAEYLELAPTTSWALSDSFSIGVSPIIVLGEVFLDPFVATAPNPTYPRGTGSYMRWGGGVQAGCYYIASDAWRFGAAIKSPDWMQPFEYNLQDDAGAPIQGQFHLDLPMIVSGGVAYDGWENILLAADVRYFDYENTEGFEESGFAPDGSLLGLGWESVLSVSTGIQLRLTEGISLRTGYTFNENPIPDIQTTIAVAAPLHYQHQVHVGASYCIARSATVSLAYSYYFEHEITGPIVTPLGAVPGSSVTSRMEAHIAALGVTLGY